MTATRRPVVALATGDPNGIGPEIAVKAAVTLAAGNGPVPLIVGDPAVLRPWLDRLAAGLAVVETDGTRISPTPAIHVFPIEALPRHARRPGTVCAEAGTATVAYIEAGLRLCHDGRAQALVGCPHSETAINAAGIPFSGYPSLLARLTGRPEDRVFLMLIGDRLRIIHATLHERLQDALARLSPALVEATALAADAALRRLGIARPRLGVFGINPHAGEGGLFGDDDQRITEPAVRRLLAGGLRVEGPLGADLMLGRTDIDAFVAMYHDQGHIPIKLLAGRTAVALTVGADTLFASTGHGSAHDIAGRGIAEPDAVLRALALMQNLTAPAAQQAAS
ncbi:PdxA family dehydrogenase [Ferrovibrio xuzhouensis]|uniref:PdxA family protein n=1 Tax=Ferrovibrio xuzhouensis TaxID=1576914 RepID=A0ABV7VLI1_9PROT